jgi:hypothetical protein
LRRTALYLHFPMANGFSWLMVAIRRRWCAALRAEARYGTLLKRHR